MECCVGLFDLLQQTGYYLRMMVRQGKGKGREEGQ